MYYPPEFASELGYIRHPILSDVYSMGASLCELFSEQWFWNLGGKRLSDVQVDSFRYLSNKSWVQPFLCLGNVQNSGTTESFIERVTITRP